MTDGVPPAARVVAITGASDGIGLATALRLARDRAALAICARRSDRLATAAAAIEGAGGTVLAVPADVTDAAAVTNFVARAVERFGRLDVMICNAGFGLYGLVDEVEPARMQRVMDVNFMGTYHAVHAALPVFRRQAAGHLVIVSSIAGKRGVPFMGPYVATKFAQAGLAECLRAELLGTAIHVSTVYPISTETGFFAAMTEASGFATRATGPRQRPEAVADAIVRALGRPVPEIYPYRPSKGLAVLNAVAPGLCDRLVRRWKREPLPPTAT